MGKFFKVLGVTLGCLVLLLVVLRVTGFGPHGRIPGLWLNGQVVRAPVSNWSFTNSDPTLEIQTSTWYGIPHSVTTQCVSYKGQLFMDSIYPPGVKYPYGRDWNENVARDPVVRIKIGDNLYGGMLIHITDPAVIAAVVQAKTKKYPRMRGLTRASVQLFHFVQTGAPQAAGEGY